MTAAPTYELPIDNAPLSERDDAELVRRSRDGDDDAFTALVERHQSRLKANSRSIVTGADLDDVHQRAWIKIYRKLHTLRQPRFFYAWANRIMINTALAFVRKRSRRTMVDVDDLPPAATPIDERPDAEERTQWRDLVERTRDWFDDICARDRKLFELYVVEGLTMDEIGDEVGLSSGGVKVRLYRARQRLRARRDAAS